MQHAGRPQRSHRRSSSGLGLLAPPTESSIIDSLVKDMRSAASRGSMDLLAAAAQRVADYLQHLLTEDTPLAALEAASAIMADVLQLLSVATLAVTHHEADEACLAALTLLIPLIHSPATNPATKVIQVDSALNCALRLCSSEVSAAVFARAVDAFIEVEGSASTVGAIAVHEIIAKATEPLAEYAAKVFGETAAEEEGSGIAEAFFARRVIPSTTRPATYLSSTTAAILVGIKTVKVAIHRGAHLIDSIAYVIAWCATLVDHPCTAVRDAASELMYPLLSCAKKESPTRLDDISALAVQQLQKIARGATGPASNTTTATDHHGSNGSGLDREVGPTVRFGETAMMGGSNRSSRDSLEHPNEAQMLIEALPPATAAAAAVTIVEAVAGCGGLTPMQIESALNSLATIALHLFRPRRLTGMNDPDPDDTAASVSHLGDGTLADERVTMVLRCIVSLRRADGSRFVKAMAHDGVATELLRALVKALSTTTPGVKAYSGVNQRFVGARRLFFNMLSYLAETRCQLEGRVDGLTELAPLVVLDLSLWLEEFKVDQCTIASGEVAATLLPPEAQSTVPEPACCRLASSFAFLCRDERHTVQLLIDISVLFAECHVILRRLRGPAEAQKSASAAAPTSSQRSRSNPSRGGGSSVSIQHQSSTKKAGSAAAAKPGGATVAEVLTVVSKASGFAKHAVTETVSRGVVDAVAAACTALSNTPTAPLVAAVSGALLGATSVGGITQAAAIAALKWITQWFDTHAGGEEPGRTAVQLRHGLHIALAHVGIYCSRWLENAEPGRSPGAVGCRPGELPLHASRQVHVSAWVEAALRFAAAWRDDELSAHHATTAVEAAVEGAGPFPADVVAVMREAGNLSSDRSMRWAAPYAYLFSLDKTPPARPRSPVSVHVALTRPSALQFLVTIASNHPPAAPYRRFANGMTARGLVDHRSATLAQDADSNANGSNAGCDAVVLLCRAAIISPGACNPTLRRVLLNAINALVSCTSSANSTASTGGAAGGKQRGAANAGATPGPVLAVGGYAQYSPRLRRRVAERTLLDILREAPLDFVSTYCGAVLTAVATASRVGKSDMDLTHASIALIANTASALAVYSSSTTATLHASIRAVFAVACKDPSLLTMLHCAVSLAAIVRVVPLPPLDGHALMDFCLGKLRRLGNTPADQTLRKALLRLAGAVGAGLVPPPTVRPGKKAKTILGATGKTQQQQGMQQHEPSSPATPSSTKPSRHPTPARVSADPNDDVGAASTFSLNFPQPMEETKMWVGRVVVATLRDLVRQHAEASITQTRYALRALCDVVFAASKHLVQNASTVPGLIDDVLECLSASCARLAKEQLDTDTPTVVQVAELCVSLLALVMHCAPWARGRVPDIIAAFASAESVSRGVLHLALARGWVILSTVAPVDVLPYLPAVINAQIRVLSTPLPAVTGAAPLSAPSFSADRAHRDAAFEVLEAVTEIPNAVSGLGSVVRVLCQVATSGSAQPQDAAPATPSGSSEASIETMVTALRIRALVSAVRAILCAAVQSNDVAAVAPQLAHILARLSTQRFDGPSTVPIARQASTHPAAASLLAADSGAAKHDALGLIAYILLHQVCNVHALSNLNAAAVAVHLTPVLRANAAKVVEQMCSPLGLWPLDMSHPSVPALAPTVVNVAAPTLPPTQAAAAPIKSSSARRYDKAVRGSSSRGDSEGTAPHWELEALQITDDKCTDAVPRMARIMAHHSLYDEVVACSDVVELSHDVARALFHVIALPYLTDHRTEQVRPIFHNNAIILSRGTAITTQQDARLLLQALIFVEHDTHATRALTLAASRPNAVAHNAAQQALSAAIPGHVAPRLVAPKMPLAWSSAPLTQLCEAALKVGDTASAAVLAEAAVFAALQQLRGDDRVSWMMRNGKLQVIARPPIPTPTSSNLSSSPNTPSSSRRPSAQPLYRSSPTPDAVNNALNKLNEACTTLLRVTTFDSPLGASHGLVDSLAELVLEASNGLSTLAVPPSVYQALDLHQRAIDAYDAIGHYNGLRGAAGKTKSLMATGRLQECMAICREALANAPSPNQSPTHINSFSSAFPSSNSLSSPPPPMMDFGEDENISDQLPTSARDVLCDYAAFAAWSLGEWTELRSILASWSANDSSSSTANPTGGASSAPFAVNATGASVADTVSNAALRRRKYYEAVLALSRRDSAAAATILQECWSLVASASAGFGTNAAASISALVLGAAELQHLAELEEVAVVAEEPSLQPIFQAHWLRRLDAMTAAPSIRSGLTLQWQRSLAVVALALPVAVHAEPFLKLVGVARKQNEVALATTTMKRVLSHSIAPNPAYHTAEFLSTATVDPRVLLTVAKCHVEFTGDAALAAWAILRFLQERAAYAADVGPLDPKTRSKCFRKLAKWEEKACGVSAVRDPASRIAISSHEYHAIFLNPDYAKPWKRWAVHNLKVAKLLFPAALFAPLPEGIEDSFRKDLIACSAHVHCALRGFVTVLELEGSDTKVENILNVCNILFDYGGICSVSRALSSLPYRVPVACWSGVVSQIVARALDPRPRVRRVIHDVLLRLGSVSPHEVVVPLLAARQSCHTQYVEARSDSARAAAQANQEAIEHLLNGLRAAPGGDEIVSEASRFVAGLNYAAVLTLEQFHHALTQAINTYRSTTDALALLDALEGLVTAWNAPVVPFELSGVATSDLPVVRPLASFNTDRHTRHFKEKFDGDVNGSGAGTCSGALGKHRMWMKEVARQRLGRPSVLEQRAEVIGQIQARVNEQGRPLHPQLEGDVRSLQQRLMQLDEEAQKERREAATRLQAVAEPFRRLAQLLADEYLVRVTSIDTREVHPPLATAKNLKLKMLGAPSTDTATIASVEPRLSVMKSVHRPKQLRVLSSAGRRHMYLLKGREDQRQDERVMQLFRFVNDYLSKADSRGLTLLRFSVIPLSGSTGVIQWVADAPTFGTILREHRGGTNDANLVHAERAVLNDVMSTYADYDRLSSVQRLDVFTTLTETTDCTDFRSWMRLGSRSTETYVANRRAYVDSIATTSMVGYVLGLGDRHPNNFLIRQSDFRVVHIDFGDSFEVAQLRSRIPETVPFRLTRQLTCALDLSGTPGAFRATAELVTRTMRRHKAGVLALLDSFVHDPSLDWRSKTDRRQTETAVTSGTDSAAYRRARAAMRRVELKLCGMEGPVTMDAPKCAAALHARLAGVTHHRSLHPRLCDCSSSAACSDGRGGQSPADVAAPVTAMGPTMSPSSNVSPGTHGGNFSFASSQLDDELSPPAAAVAIQGWWRKQLHRRGVEKQPDLRLKPSSSNFEQSIRRTVAVLDPERGDQGGGLALLQLYDRARQPIYDLWGATNGDLRGDDSDVSSLDGAHVTPPTIDDPAAMLHGLREVPGLVVAPKPLSEAAQVRRVTDMAVSEVNLARLYSGWFPWW